MAHNKSAKNGHRRSTSHVNGPGGDSRERTPSDDKPKAEFKTDADISGKFQARERELQRWVPDEDTPVVSLEGGNDGAWDQFKVNEEKFGVESTYDEHLYTTRINTTVPDYQKRVEYADRIAKEIEGQVTTDRHVLEERGVQVDDSGVDEEDKYSGVDRRGDELMAQLRNASILGETKTSSPTPGKYVTPKHRAAQYHNDPAIVLSSATSRKGANASPAEDALPPKPNNESFRLNAQSEINSLREFSANFKIPHKMPQDLLPILSKDKVKQDEILKKQEPKAASPPKKMDPTKPAFKPNPKAAVFTPSQKHSPVVPPQPPKAPFQRLPSTKSPRMNSQRPYSSGSLSSGSKRHYQISPADFFGGADRVPTKHGQEEKIRKLKQTFNLFVTAQNKHDKASPLVLQKTFHTPPTWDFTIDESHDKLFPQGAGFAPVVVPGTPSLPFVPSPLAPGGAPSPGAGYPGAPGKYPLSPREQHQQAAAIAFQQQQFHAAMMYQQLQLHPQQFLATGAPPVPSPVPMYAPTGEPYLPPGGFMVPPTGFIGGSPVNAKAALGGQYENYNHYNRRYQGKRGSQNQ